MHQKVLGAPPLTKAEEVVLGYLPEEKEPGTDDFQAPAYGPRDFDVDKEGNIYIVDTLKQRVVKFDKQGRYVLSFGKKGNIVHLSRPINIAIDGQGNAYVKDLDNDRCIFRFDSSGNLLEKITSIGSYSSGQIKWFSALESDERGHVFIRAKVGEKKYVNFELDKGGKVIREFQGPLWKRDGKGMLYKDCEEFNDTAFPKIKGSKRPVQILTPDGKIEKEITLDFGTESAVYFALLGVDDEGCMYYINGNRDTDTLLKFDNNGKLVEKITIKPRNTLGMSNYGFKILPDGTIYQMHATDEGLEIIKYSPVQQKSREVSK
jgi:antitoxin component YwqK of YwqJK toxin-antitoxin module